MAVLGIAVIIFGVDGVRRIKHWLQDPSPGVDEPVVHLE